MKPVIVSDTSPLIALAKLDHLDLLFASFIAVYIPESVYREATQDRYRQDSQKIHDFIETQDAVTIHPGESGTKYNEFRHLLDEGESQALALAKKVECGVLIDERLGRLIAKQQQIPVVGVMGVLLQAKSVGKISAVKPLIEQLLLHDYRLSDRVIELVLHKAGE